MKTRTKTQRRPKWALPLSKSAWRHMQEAQNRKVPTFPQLLRDSGTCPDCARIMAILERAANEVSA